MPVGLGGEQLWLSPTNSNNINPFDDQSGNSINGTANGGITTVPDTTAGGQYAYSLDGSTGFISGLGQATWNFVNQTGVFSISAWCKSDAVTANSQSVVGSNVATAKTGFSMVEATTSGGLIGSRFDMTKGTSGIYQAQTSDSKTSGFTSWKCMTATGDGTTLRLYVDGVQIGTSSIALPMTNAQSGQLYVGCYQGYTAFYDGLMDDLRIYDRTISNAEIKHLATSRGILGSPTYTGLGGETLWLSPSISGVNQATSDLSGNGNNGTLTGSCSAVTQSGKGGTAAFSSASYTADFVSVPNVLPATTVRSVSCWVYGNTIGAFQTNKLFASSLFQMKTQGFGEVVTVQTLQASPWSQTYMMNSNPSSVNGEWHHYCLVQDGTDAKAYLDGSLVSTTTLDPNVDVTGDSATIELNKIAGYGDDYRTFSRALTAQEVAHLATSRGIQGSPQTGLGDEELWIAPSLSKTWGDLSGNFRTPEIENGAPILIIDDEFDGSTAIEATQNEFLKVENFGRMDTAPFASQDQLTVSVWAKTSTAATLIQFWCGSSSPSFVANNSTNYWFGAQRYFRFSTSAYFDLINNVPPFSDTWGHWAFTIDNRGGSISRKAYLNGVEVQSSTNSTYNVTQPNDFLFGNNNTAAGTSCLDDLRVFSRILSDDEIYHLASKRGATGTPAALPQGLGDEDLWLLPSHTQTYLDVGPSKRGQQRPTTSVSVVPDASNGGTHAMDFPGSNDPNYSLVRAPEVTTSGTTSTSCWYYFDSENIGGSWDAPTFWIQRNLGYNIYYWGEIGVHPNGTFYKQNGSTSYNTSTPSSGWAPYDQWFHICITSGSRGMQLYVNGTLVGSRGNVNTSYNSPYYGIGGAYLGSYNAIGRIDDFRRFDRELSLNEISWLGTSRGQAGPVPTGFGDEVLWYTPSTTNNYDAYLNSGYTGSPMGSVSIVSDTAAGGQYAFNFTGAQADRIILNVGSGIIDFINTNAIFSFAAWVYVDNTATARTFFGTQINNYSEGFKFANDTGTYDTEVMGSWNPTPDISVQQGTATSGQWVHFASVSDGTTVRHYENGVVVGSGSVSQISGMGGSAFNAFIGGYDSSFGPANEAMSGRMDDIRIFDRPLTQPELDFLAVGRTQYGPAPVEGIGDEKLWVNPTLSYETENIVEDKASTNPLTVNSISTVTDTNSGAYNARALVFNQSSSFSNNLQWSQSGYNGGMHCFWFKNEIVGSQTFKTLYYIPGTATNGVHQFQCPSSAGASAYNWNDSQGMVPNGVLNATADGNWHHLAYHRMNGGNDRTRFYLDGVLMQDVPADGTANGSWASGTMVIGVATNGSGRTAYNFRGWMDDIRVFDRELTPLEVKHIAQNRQVQGPDTTQIIGLGREDFWLSPDISGTPLENISEITTTSAPVNNNAIPLGRGLRGITRNVGGQESSLTWYFTQDNIDCSYNPSLDSSSEYFSFAFWFDQDTNGSDSVVCTQAPDNVSDGWGFRFTGTTLIPWFYSNQWYTGTSTGIPNDELHHYAVNVFDDHCDIYIDGTYNQAIYFLDPAVSNGDLHLGSFDNGLAGTSAFSITDFRLITSGTLGQNEIDHIEQYPGILGRAAGNITMIAATGTFNITVNAADLKIKTPIQADTGVFNITFPNTTLDIRGKVEPNQSYSIVVNGATLSPHLNTTVASYAIGVNDAVLNPVLSTSTTSYAITVNPANLTQITRMAADTGSFVYTFYEAGQHYYLDAETASYTIAVNPADLVEGERFPAGAGQFAISVSDADFNTRLKQTVATSYTVTVNPVNMNAGGNYQLNAGTGSYSIAVNDASFTQTFSVIADTGTFSITVNPAQQRRKVNTGQFSIAAQEIFSGVIFETGHASFVITVTQIAPPPGVIVETPYYFRLLLQGNK